ncbi:MAG TPA: IscS subfamily cysteine desulfurase [Bacteroidota bacterium]|nr:IscS subfamily cysteine desulfurase [Bacteroidota bacterium]
MNALRLPVYLDNHATTRVDHRVLDAMLPYFTEHYGNAASRQHEFGWRAEAAVENARKHIAALIGASPEEIVFTSGATESINLALKGVAEGYTLRGKHMITAATEHKAVLDCCKRLERYGFRITVLPVDRHGAVDLDALRAALSSETILVSIMAANNEIGTIAPVEEIGKICRERGVLFHTDATQAVGKIPMNVSRMSIDLMSFSAHKMYGPKGIGALFVRSASPRLQLAPLIDGGGHERGLRSGTLNVPAIVGFGEAARIASMEMAQEQERIGRLRDTFVARLQASVRDMWLNGHPTNRLAGNANITFRHANADKVMMEMKDVAVSSGSACSSAQPEPSHVLRAIGLSVDDAKCSLRFGLGRFTTAEEIEYAATRVVESVEKVRARSFVHASSGGVAEEIDGMVKS